MKTKPDRYLLKRGNNYYCSWRQNGRLITRALRDEHGQPVTTLVRDFIYSWTWAQARWI